MAGFGYEYPLVWLETTADLDLELAVAAGSGGAGGLTTGDTCDTGLSGREKVLGGGETTDATDWVEAEEERSAEEKEEEAALVLWPKPLLIESRKNCSNGSV